MRMHHRLTLTAALALALAGCGSKPAEDTSAEAPAETAQVSEAAPAVAEATPAAGAVPVAFAQCHACHSVESGKNGVGPSLAGVFGRKAGSAPGYAYSDANKNSGLTWDEATLDEYLTAPMKKVPGTKMVFAGLTDAAKRKDVIEYLKTLK
jgi:cytochrome c2